jgi:hypothetical protein
MAQIKIKQKKDPYIIDRMIAEEIKEKWMEARKNGKLDQTVDIGEWTGPFRKIESIELSNISTKKESSGKVLLDTNQYSSSCCKEGVYGRDGNGFECAKCGETCRIIINR